MGLRISHNRDTHTPPANNVLSQFVGVRGGRQSIFNPLVFAGTLVPTDYASWHGPQRSEAIAKATGRCDTKAFRRTRSWKTFFFLSACCHEWRTLRLSFTLRKRGDSSTALPPDSGRNNRLVGFKCVGVARQTGIALRMRRHSDRQRPSRLVARLPQCLTATRHSLTYCFGRHLLMEQW